MHKLLFIFLILSNFWVYEINQGVNLRKGPDNNKRVLTTVPQGEVINVLEQTNEWWWKVEYKGKTGYIAVSFISKSYPKTILSAVQIYPIQSLILFLITVLLLLSLKKKLFKKKKSKKK